MTDTPTPGQVCYQAYQTAYDCFIWTLPWGQLQPHFRHVWEVAAQAVLAMQDTSVHMSRDDFDHLLTCLAKQKFLHEMAGSLIWENRKQAAEIQATIDAAWRKGMALLSPKEELS